MMINDESHFYKSIFNNAGFAVIIKDLDGYVLEGNDAAIEMFGYSAEELTTKKREDLIILNAETAKEYKTDITKFKKKSTQANAIKKNGEIFPIKFFLFFIEAQNEENKKICLFINDVSEEVEKEKKLERTVEILEEVTEIARVGGYEVDVLTGNATWTKETKEIHELTIDYEPKLDKAILFFKEGEVRDTITRLVKDAIELGLPFSEELPLTTAKGNERWVRVTGNTEFKDGRCVRLYGIVQDIHQSKLMQDDLMKERTMLRTLIDNLPDPIFVKDYLGRKLIANKADVKNIGAEMEKDVLGKNDTELFQTNLAHLGYQRDMQVIGTGEPSIDALEVFYNNNGNEKVYLTSKFPLKDSQGNVTGLVGICRNITEQKKIAEELQKSNERYEYATKATSDVIWESDLVTKEVFFSTNFELMFGYTTAEVQTTDSNVWRNNVYPDDFDSMQQKKMQMLQSDDDRWDNEYRFKKANGELAWILDKTFIIRNSEGKPIKLVGAIRDITTKKAEEEQLKLLESVVTHSKDAILVTTTEVKDGVDTPILYVNRAFTEITGYTLEDVEGKNPRFLQGPLSDKKELEKFRQAIKNWLTCEIEIINYTKNGNTFWSSVSIVPIANEKGWFTHWVAIQRDITARKKAEEAFNQMAALQKSILDSTNFAIISTDVSGIIRSFNQGAEKLLGYSIDEVVDKEKPRIFHDIKELEEKAKRLSEESGVTINSSLELLAAKAKTVAEEEEEWTYIHKDGHRIPVSLSVTSLWDKEKKEIGYLGIAKDITVEKDIKEALRLSNMMLEDTISELKQQQFAVDQHAIVSITDIKGDIIYANEGFCKVSKYTIDELIGQNHRILKSGYHPTSVFTEMYHTIANGNVWKGDLCNKAKDGSLYWVSNTIVPYIDTKTNKPMQYVSIRTDITDKKMAELDREKLLRELTDNNRELKQFSYITTHNLRAPLTNLISICNLIKTDTISDPLTLRLIDGFKKSTFDLNETLKDLINVLIIKQNTNLPSGEVQFDTMLEKVVLSINKSIENSGAIIQSDFAKAPSVHFYSTYLESILLNLITNSIKYAKPTVRLVIKITTSKNFDGTIRFVFSDNGIGMSMDRVKDKIFGLYQRFHSNADSKGIGLYLIQSQIHALGGTIEFESEENIGTTFTVTFK